MNIDSIFALKMLIHAVIDLQQGFGLNRCQIELSLAVQGEVDVGRNWHGNQF